MVMVVVRGNIFIRDNYVPVPTVNMLARNASYRLTAYIVTSMLLRAFRGGLMETTHPNELNATL